MRRREFVVLFGGAAAASGWGRLAGTVLARATEVIAR
jgi:hypothetical protein